MEEKKMKPLLGITCGDINGIGLEIIFKCLSDNRVLEFCTPIIFASSNLINYLNKGLENPLHFVIVHDWAKINHGQTNVFNAWNEPVVVMPGEINDSGGRLAYHSLKTAVNALQKKQIDCLVTAPICKSNLPQSQFNFTGHTPYFKEEFKLDDVLMILYGERLRVGLVTEHIPIKDVSSHLSIKSIQSKLKLFNTSLIQDFNIIKPRIAVLALNPHAGDNGLIGKEEKDIIIPAIKTLGNDYLVQGPFSADAFFAQGTYLEFDGVLAMYHDQGLIPLKTIENQDGSVNYTAGLPFVRTSPDHGPAFNIAGKGKADNQSFLSAIFEAVHLYKNRLNYQENNKNPIKKLSHKIISNNSYDE